MLIDEKEKRICQSYIADCLGAMVKKELKLQDLPLYSELIDKHKKHESTPKEIVEHVKGLFS